MWKYSIDDGAIQFSLRLPRGARFISLGAETVPSMWFLVDTEAEILDRDFVNLCTGWDIEKEGVVGVPIFIGTYRVGQYVHHIFEINVEYASVLPTTMA